LTIFEYCFLLLRHPFLLYAYYINHWKKCQNKDDLDLIDENDSGLFLNDDELAKKKTNEVKRKSTNFHLSEENKTRFIFL